MSCSSAIFYSLAGSCFAKRVNAYMPICLLLFSRKIRAWEGGQLLSWYRGEVQGQAPCTLVVMATLPPPHLIRSRCDLIRLPSTLPPPRQPPRTCHPPRANPAAAAMPAPDWSEVCIKAMTGHGHGTWGLHVREATLSTRIWTRALQPGLEEVSSWRFCRAQKVRGRRTFPHEFW